LPNKWWLYSWFGLPLVLSPVLSFLIPSFLSNYHANARH
jgi:hypothetical protein